MNEKQIKRLEELRNLNKNKNKNLKNKKDFVAVILTSLLLLLIIGLSYSYYLLTPVDKNSSDTVLIEVKEGNGAEAIATSLKENNLIKSPVMFKIYSRITGNTNFYKGNYEISPNMTVLDILEKLNTSGISKTGKRLVIIEGDNIEKIASKIEKETDISADEFIQKVNDEKFISELRTEFPEIITDALNNKNIKYKLEGYLYPASYDIDHSNSNNVELIIKEMIRQTQINVLPKFKENPKKWNISGKNIDVNFHQYLTLASIVEKESTKSAENNTAITGVFLSRLEQSIPLGTDPAIMYAVGKVELSFEDLRVNHPYNMHVNLGLPPGPISSISEKTFDAVNSAKSSEYLFFLTDKEGNAYFAKTYAEHEALARKYVPGYVSTN